ncbi:hypothetical protein CANCADRAFT_74632 [Tortispora caseinolytica NRRL Y-17796]|uniref:Maintenance of ploidy protein mob2 n=1 Tax=Tortispora caseinolytica NRRL Y-17796 TaxID=767744 RepID=A0A1E4TIU9_9ASCO|nr:hypothetical protein CANCADRAFT_74632 [Tortispora caseinolytica NRRL Y-17796]
MTIFNAFSKGFGRQSRKQNKKQGLGQGKGSETSLASSTSNASSATGSTGATTAATNNGQVQGSAFGNKKPLFVRQPFIQSALVKGSFKTIVILPRYVDLGDWLALNMFEFFSNLKQFHLVIDEFCTARTCPSMSAGPGLDYLWLDANRKPIRLPAETYTSYVLTWINNKLNDETLFPTRANMTFPANFPSTLRNIYRQMLRIFAHYYHNHFETLVHLSMEAHWNSFFAHFVSFGREFSLIDKRDIEPLQELISAFEAQGKLS